MPLAWGWYAVVVAHLVPKVFMVLRQRLEVNCFPLSVVTVSGAPKLATQVERKALTQSVAVIPDMGVATGHLVKRSTAVRTYFMPFEAGSGPTMSTWTC